MGSKLWRVVDGVWSVMTVSKEEIGRATSSSDAVCDKAIASDDGCSVCVRKQKQDDCRCEGVS